MDSGRQGTIEKRIVCEGGVLNGQWFTSTEWDTRQRAQQRMRDLGTYRSRGALDYLETPRTIDHPKDPGAVGVVHEYRWK